MDLIGYANMAFFIIHSLQTALLVTHKMKLLLLSLSQPLTSVSDFSSYSYNYQIIKATLLFLNPKNSLIRFFQ